MTLFKIDPPRFLKVPEVCELLGVEKHTLKNWRLQGVGPPHVFLSSRLLRYPSEELEAWASDPTRGKPQYEKEGSGE